MCFDCGTEKGKTSPFLDEDKNRQKKERKDGIAFGLPGWQQTFHL